jgi:hypothetical protein
MTDVDALMQEDAARERAATPDKLTAVLDCARRLRDVESEIEDIKQRLTEANKKKSAIEFDELPQLMLSCGMTKVTLDAQGNHPAQEVSVSDYYHANVSAEWDEERRERAFAWLGRHQMTDAIKAEVSVLIPLGEGRVLKRVVAALRKLRVQHTVSRSIPWGTLTAYVRERYERSRPLSDDDLRVIGATVRKIARIKPVKERRED